MKLFNLLQMATNDSFLSHFPQDSMEDIYKGKMFPFIAQFVLRLKQHKALDKK